MTKIKVEKFGALLKGARAKFKKSKISVLTVGLLGGVRTLGLLRGIHQDR